MRGLFRNVLVALAALLIATPSFAKDDKSDATVVCKDGTSAKRGRGACGGHGGVDKAATAKAAGTAAGAAADAKGEQAKESVEKGGAKASSKADEKAAATTVVCKDGTTSKGGRGACRGHGGIDKAAMAKGSEAAALPPVPATPPPAAAPRAPAAASQTAPAAAAAQRAEKSADEKGPPTARCKDGTFSYAKHHTGACSGHGGVADWLDKDKK